MLKKRTTHIHDWSRSPVPIPSLVKCDNNCNKLIRYYSNVVCSVEPVKSSQVTHSNSIVCKFVSVYCNLSAISDGLSKSNLSILFLWSSSLRHSIHPSIGTPWSRAARRRPCRQGSRRDRPTECRPCSVTPKLSWRFVELNKKHINNSIAVNGWLAGRSQDRKKCPSKKCAIFLNLKIANFKNSFKMVVENKQLHFWKFEL